MPTANVANVANGPLKQFNFEPTLEALMLKSSPVDTHKSLVKIFMTIKGDFAAYLGIKGKP